VRRLAKQRTILLTIVGLRRSQSDDQGVTVPIRKGCRKGNGKKETENGKGKTGNHIWIGKKENGRKGNLSELIKDKVKS